MANMILVNSRFTASTFVNTFMRLHSRGIQPAVLYPAVNVDQFSKPHYSKLNFLSINRFERKKNIELAVSAFTMLHSLDVHALQNNNVADATLTIAGGYDKRLRENVEYLEELGTLAERGGVSLQVNFITSCSSAERNILLSQCLCVIYTPKCSTGGNGSMQQRGPVETDGVTGFLCDSTPKSFSLAMAKLIQDPVMAKIMGEAAKHHVTESFSTNIFGHHLNEYIVNIANSKEDEDHDSKSSLPFA